MRRREKPGKGEKLEEKLGEKLEKLDTHYLWEKPGHPLFIGS
jgi:hypothetical protein